MKNCRYFIVFHNAADKATHILVTLFCCIMEAVLISQLFNISHVHDVENLNRSLLHVLLTECD